MFRPRRLQTAASTANWDAAGRLATPAGELAYWTAGAGPLVLCAHGWESTHVDFDAFVAPLAARGLGVVAFDHLGHGESAGERATLYDFRDDVLALGERFGPFAGVVGHSLGAATIAMALREGLVARRVALISSPTHYDDFVRGYAAAAGVRPEPFFEEVRNLGIDSEAMYAPRVVAGLTEPVLIVHSADDRVTNIAGSEKIAAAWRGSRLLRVEGLGHKRLLRDASTIAAIVDFLSESEEAKQG